MGTVDIGGNNYEVYGDLDAANLYLAARIGTSKWDAKDDTGKSQVMVTVARYLNRKRWKGAKTSDSQPLAHPRAGVEIDGVEIDDSVIHADVLAASYELCLILSDDPSIESATGTGSNVRRAKGGKAEVEFFRPTAGTFLESRFPTIVQELLGPFLAASGLLPAVPYAGGTSEGTSWSEFGLTT